MPGARGGEGWACAFWFCRFAADGAVTRTARRQICTDPSEAGWQLGGGGGGGVDVVFVEWPDGGAAAAALALSRDGAGGGRGGVGVIGVTAGGDGASAAAAAGAGLAATVGKPLDRGRVRIGSFLYLFTAVLGFGCSSAVSSLDAEKGRPRECGQSSCTLLKCCKVLGIFVAEMSLVSKRVPQPLDRL